MTMDFVEKAKEIKKTKDDGTTIAEHMAILLQYKQTGYLDRNDAIKKYKEFNDNHLDYYIPMRATTISTGTAANIEDVPNEVIVKNLGDQLFYLTGKSFLEEWNNGQPAT